jgi:hypothetical protein
VPVLLLHLGGPAADMLQQWPAMPSHPVSHGTQGTKAQLRTWCSESVSSGYFVTNDHHWGASTCVW